MPDGSVGKMEYVWVECQLCIQVKKLMYEQGSETISREH